MATALCAKLETTHMRECGAYLASLSAKRRSPAEIELPHCQRVDEACGSLRKTHMRSRFQHILADRLDASPKYTLVIASGKRESDVFSMLVTNDANVSASAHPPEPGADWRKH